MNEKRFEYDEKDNIIYDNQEGDDYYFLNKPQEIKDFIKLLNKNEEYWQEKYGDVLKKYKKQLQLNIEQEKEINQLKKELEEMKDKAYHYGCCAIGETSTNYDKDIDNFRKEIYGDKAEQITQKEIEEDKKLYSRNTEHELPKKHNECIHYWEKLHECGDGHWWVERGCDLNPHLEVFGVCEDFKEKPPKKYYEV